MTHQLLPEEDFNLIAQFEWQRVQVAEEAVPEPLRNLPSDLKPVIYVSGSHNVPARDYNDKRFRLAEIVGGVDVFREDLNDDPYIFNRDHYHIIRTATGLYWLIGPTKIGDAIAEQHWLESIPQEYTCATVFVKDSMLLRANLVRGDHKVTGAVQGERENGGDDASQA